MVDLIYGSNPGWTQKDSFSSIISRLESRGRDVERINPSDLDPEEGTVSGHSREELDEVPLLYRRKRGFSSDQVSRDLHALDSGQFSRGGYSFFERGPNVLPNVNDVMGAENKSVGKDNFRRNRVPHVPEYDVSTARAAHAAGHALMEKPETGSLGNGVRPVMPDDSFSPDPDKIYEPLVKHHDEHSPWVERRAVGFAGRHSKGVFAAKDRVLKDRKDSDDYRPMNISNGNGNYSDFDPVESPFTFEDAAFVLDAIEANGGGAQGVDYLYNRQTGQRVVIETNSTVDVSGIRKASWRASREDIDSHAADVLEKEIEGERFYGMTENLKGYDFDFQDDDPEDMGEKLMEIPWNPEHLPEGYANRVETTPEPQYSGNTVDSAA